MANLDYVLKLTQQLTVEDIVSLGFTLNDAGTSYIDSRGQIAVVIGDLVSGISLNTEAVFWSPRRQKYMTWSMLAHYLR